MRGGRLLLLKIAITALTSVAYTSDAWPQETVSEREGVLAALKLSYGQSVDKGRPVFTIAAGYLLSPVFTADGLLIEISIEPKSNNHAAQLSRSEFESLLANVNSIKPLGEWEEDFPGKFVHGGRAWDSVRYQKAYLQTAELIMNAPPRPLSFAHIYYLHPVTGVAKIPQDSKPEDAGSFGLVCVGGKFYIAPKAEFLKLWSQPNKQQTVEIAGPTRDNSSECGR